MASHYRSLKAEKALMATEYWLSAGPSLPKEARLVALQRRLGGYRVLVGQEFSEDGRAKVLSVSADLFDVMTGCTFARRTRAADISRCSSSAPRPLT